MSETVAVLDYGMGNLHSVGKALERVADGQRIVVTGDPDQLRAADRVVFPGVGAIRDCIKVVVETGLDRALLDVIDAGKPLLGVCVGMQALMAFSEENQGVDCLGVLPGRVSYFGEQYGDTGQRLKVPHMGWNQVRQMQAHPMWAGIDEDSRFYFVHSYCVTGLPAAQVAGRCEYGIEFAAAAAERNVFAVQFHPEKSADAGLRLLENFLRWQP